MKICFYFVIFRIEKLNTGNSSIYRLSMKTWSQQIIFLTVLFVAFASGAFAQDAGMSDSEVVATSMDEKGVFTPGEEVRYVPGTAGIMMANDSIALQMHDFPMQRAAQKTSEKAPEKQTAKSKEDILTFNFLYYIIQKYKLQDVID